MAYSLPLKFIFQKEGFVWKILQVDADMRWRVRVIQVSYSCLELTSFVTLHDIGTACPIE
jgi:hypothetical protein